mgnify:CR=1 FL=1|tara:strand:+ start:62 stop:826 length:765 start_codon:yes stop_codon:yes gene_type:complete
MKPLIDYKDGNFKCISTIKELIPRGNVVHSHLLYNGQIELALASDMRFVCAHTTQYVVYEFWKCAMEEPQKLYDIITAGTLKFDNENMLSLLQESWTSFSDPYVRASLFYILSKCTDEGLISSGKLKNPQLSPVSLRRLKTFKPVNFHVLLDKEVKAFESPEPIKAADYLLCPMGRFAYNMLDENKSIGPETTLIKHAKLAAHLQQMTQRWVVVYKYHPALLQLYNDCRTIQCDEFGEKTTQKTKTAEVIFANF